MTINPDPQSLPTAAQIPLQNFHLPPFPTEAANLKLLTLTSDIKPTDYADLLSTPLPQDAIPPTLPRGIESLTLELFSLGYPAPFLTRLGNALPNLKDLTLYSHLIDGVSDSSRRDAGDFIHHVLTGSRNKDNSGGLRELHLLDLFCRKGFISGIGDILHDLSSNGDDPKSQSALRFLEVSYTYRGHSDGKFLSRIPVDELPKLLVGGLVAVSLRLEAITSATTGASDTGLEGVPDDPADVDENGERVGRKPEGIVPVGSGDEGTKLLVEKLAGAGTGEEVESVSESESESESGLRMLDCTLYALSLEQLRRVLKRQRRLAVLSVSVLVSQEDDAKRELLEALKLGSEDLQVLEVVGVPGSEWKDVADSVKSGDLFRDVFPSSSDMLDLAAALPRLESFSMTILRAPAFGSVSWVNRDGKWVDGTA